MQGGAINLTGGTVGTNNYATILVYGDQTISGNPDITLKAGASGGAPGGFGNAADISINGIGTEKQIITAHDLKLQGGSAGIGNLAVIGTYVTGQSQSITATGVVDIVGGAGIDAGAAIGNPKVPWGPYGDVNLILNATGSVTLTAGTGAVGTDGIGGIALIGAIGGFNADVTINGQSGIALVKGSASNNAMIGSDTGGGTLVVRSGLGGAGGIALNDGLVKTTGTVALTASGSGAISQSTTGIVSASTLTTNSSAGTTLGGANTVSSFNATNTASGNIVLTDTATTLTVSGISQSGGGNVSVTNTGAITSTGAITANGVGQVAVTATGTTGDITLNGGTNTAGGTITMSADRDLTINSGGDITTPGSVGLNAGLGGAGTISEAGTGKVLNSALLGTFSRGGTTLNGANTVGAFFATNQTSGGITLNNTGALTLYGIAQSASGAVSITNTGSIATGGTLTSSGSMSLTANGGGDIVFDAGSITASAASLSASGSIVNNIGGGTQIDTSAVGGVINMTGGTIGATGAARLGINRGTGAFHATATNGDIYLNQTAGDLNGNFTVTSSGHDAELATTNGNIIASASYSMSGVANIRFVANGTTGDIISSAPLTLSANSLTLSGTGSAQFTTSTATFNTPVTATMPVNISGATVNFNGATSSSLSTLNLSSGTLSGSGTVSVSGASSWTGGTMSGIGSTTIAFGATLNVSSAGTLTATRNFSNAGTVNVNGGTLQLSSFPTNAGTLDIAAGATLSTNNNPLTNAATGIITGNGTLDLGGTGHLLTSSGTLQPGNSPGTLTINGDVTMTSSSVTNVEIQPPGVTAGTDYDLITVTGAANLNGTLNVTHLNGFTPSAGNTFRIMTYASSTGDFVTKNFPAGFGYLGTANAANYTLSLGGVVNTWQALTGSWETASNWSLGHVPLASEDVVIPDVGVTGVSDIITVSTVRQAAKSISNAEILNVSAGDLTFTQQSASSGTVRVSGGTLVANAALSTHTLDLSSGQLTGIGNLTVTNAFTQASGTINTTGNLSITQASGNLNIANMISAANMTLAATAGSINVQDTTVAANGTMNVAASNNLNVISNTAPAELISTGMQTINVNGITAQGASSGVGLYALIEGGAGQDITVGASGINLTGGSGGNTNRALIQQLGVGSSQTITVNNGGSVNLTGGDGIFNYAIIGSDGPVQTITFTAGGSLNLTGGAGAGGDNGANLANGGSTPGLQTIAFNAGGAINLTGGTVGNGNSASIYSNTSQTISGNPDIKLTGGASGGAALSGNSVDITVGGAVGNEQQNISARNLTLQGGSSGIDNYASIDQMGASANQTITVNGGTFSLTGGGGTGGFARAANFGLAQDISVTGGGGLSLQGGNGIGGSNSAFIGTADSGAGTPSQAVHFPNGGTLQLKGGANGPNNYSAIFTLAGNQSITGSADLTVTGGSSGGGPTTSSGAGISLEGLSGTDSQSITVRNLTLQGGSGGNTNSATISTFTSGQTANITATGTVSLSGGSGLDSYAGIGSNLADVNLTLNAGGAITLSGGSGGTVSVGSIAGIGAVSGFNANVTINGQSGIALHKGAGANANAVIGSDTGGGTLVIRSGISGNGDVALNDGIVKTTGTAALTASGSGAVTQSVATPSVIASGGISLGGASIGTALNPIVFDAGGNPLSATASTGGIYLNQPAGNLLTSNFVLSSAGTGQTISLATTNGSITVDSTAGFNANTGNDVFSFTTAGTAQDIAFGSGLSLTAAGLNLAGTGNATFNAGTVTLNTPVTSTMPVNIGGATVNFNNGGTLAAVNNAGALNIGGGTLSLGNGGAYTGAFGVSSGATLQFSGGTHDVNAGATFGGSGTVAVIGAGTWLNVNTGITINNPFVLAGDTFSTLGGTGNVTLANTFDWRNGADIRGTGTLTTNGVTTIANSVQGTAVEKNWVNNGTVNMGADADLQFILSSSTITNAASGVFNQGSTLANPIAVNSGPGGAFVNAGTYNKTAAGAQTIGTGVAFTNTGTLNVQTGTLQVNNFVSNTNSGTLNIGAGATLSTNNNSLTNAGIITGNGTLNLGGAGHLLTNSGTLQPGNSPGTLTINGDLTMTSSSVTNVEIQPPGVTAGTDYDLITVTGAANLNGTLNVTHLNGFTPSAGSTFQIMNYALSTGDFVTKNFPAGFGYLGTANAATYTLSLGGVVVLPGGVANTWQALTGSWETASNWSLGHVPLASEDVVIPDVGVAGVSNTITVSTASQVAKSITNAEILNVSAGGLTFTQPSASSGTVQVSGGTLTANAALTTHTLDQSSGLLNGTGNLTVTNSFTQTGGSINVGGAASITQAVGNLSLGAITASSIFAISSGNLSVGGALNASAGGNSIVLAASGDFVNGASASALTAGSGGRWLVYTAGPDKVVKGGLTSDFRHHGATFTSYAPGSVAESGNGFIYASAADLTVTTTLTGTASNTYGNAPTAIFSYTLSGFADSEDNSTNIRLAGTAAFMPTIASTTNPGNYTVVYSSGLSSVAGYGFVTGPGVAYTVNSATATGTAITVFQQQVGQINQAANTSLPSSASSLQQDLTADAVTSSSGTSSTDQPGQTSSSTAGGKAVMRKIPVCR